jgi:hypothetical protein
MVLTGLRYFGGTSAKLVGTDVVAEAEAVAEVTKQLNTLAQQFRGASLEEVDTHLTHQPAQDVAQAISDFGGSLVQEVNDGLGVSSKPQPTQVRDV